MAINEQVRIIHELRHGPGETVEERTDLLLSKKGWDKQLAKISDEDFRAVVRQGLERLAMRHGPAGGARDIEKARRKKELERMAASGLMGDFFRDPIVGKETHELINALPSEKYWIESTAETRAKLFAAVQEHDEIGKILKGELAIIEELHTRAQARSDDPIRTGFVEAGYP